MMQLKVALLLLAWVLLPVAAYAEPALPYLDGYQHNGVASCASSVCHGKSQAVTGQNIWLNEYKVWATEDHHSRAYKTLLSEESRAIANAMGLPAAHTAKVCLDCHADNVAAEKRGPKFQLTDGVSCEACHGGSEKWLKSHTDPAATHASNLKSGMYPSENPFALATLCVSCHMGNQTKFAHHGMMAAGHPRLVFELDTFANNQPRHYEVDDDYKKRKGNPDIGSFWLAGQLVSARQQVALIKRHAGTISGTSLAVFDCHSCHHPMRPMRGQPNDASRAVPVGSLRLMDFSQDMVQVIIDVLQPARANEWQQAVTALHKASLAFNQATLSAAADKLTGLLAQTEQQLKAQALDKAAMKALRKAIAFKAQEGVFNDYNTAEQAVLAVESLSYSLGDHGALSARLDQVFVSLQDENQYRPELFKQGMKALYAAL